MFMAFFSFNFVMIKKKNYNKKYDVGEIKRKSEVAAATTNQLGHYVLRVGGVFPAFII